MWIRTKTIPAWYIAELRGVCYITWVSEKDKAHATIFPVEKIGEWIDVVDDLTGFNNEAVRPFA